MCGRYESAVSKELLDEIFRKYIGKLHIDYDLDEVFKEENIAPTNRVRVIVLEDGEYRLKSMKWAIRSKVFDPARKSSGKDPFVEKDIFNSKIETVTKSKNWKPLFETSRCLFPMSAFYEWVSEGGKKKPKRISIKKEKCFFAGGIFREHDIRNETGASIITCEPNTVMKGIHNRMPVLFTPEHAGEFLSLPYDGAAAISVPLEDNIKLEIKNADI